MANMRVNAVLDKSLSTESSGVHRNSWRSQTGDGREADYSTLIDALR
jgi:hypothetical protein